MTTEKRVADLETAVADLLVRLHYAEDKLFEATDRIRELERDSFIALAAFYRTHPETLVDLDKIDALLGTSPSGKK